MRFEQISAQGVAIRTLQGAITTGKVSHAYLFVGPPGVGKQLTATALAMTLNCLEQKNDACGVCPSCKKVKREVHPDVFAISLPKGKQRISIESVRDLTRRLSVSPHEGRAKVAIIEPADRMSESAANALLKTLEEPRLGSFLVLITSRASSLLPTVRSRCQLVRFGPLPENIVAEILESQGIETEEALVVAALSGGSMKQATAYLGKELDERVEEALSVLEGALDPTPLKGLSIAALFKRERDEVLALLDLLTTMLSEVLWHSTHPEEEHDRILFQKFGDRLSRVARAISIARMAMFVSVANRASQRIQNNNMNPQLALEGMLLSMRDRTDDGLVGSGFGSS